MGSPMLASDNGDTAPVGNLQRHPPSGYTFPGLGQRVV